jgi:hypothetical protein
MKFKYESFEKALGGFKGFSRSCNTGLLNRILHEESKHASIAMLAKARS